ncbi:MAG: hypothetical protein AMJ53_18590 [Gammaproteobacteria bacterium SG8_11]|nr:MAG: hypothetical protein AMJ53_18590 [Gammaproteobacteria bacterium SG8_11]
MYDANGHEIQMHDRVIVNDGRYGQQATPYEATVRDFSVYHKMVMAHPVTKGENRWVRASQVTVLLNDDAYEERGIE